MNNNNTKFIDRQLYNVRRKYVKIVPQREVCDIVMLSYRPRCCIRKVGKHHYIRGRFDEVENKFHSDGEVIEVRESNGERNKRSLRKIFVDMRQLINNNFSQEESENQIFLTLTYAENMTDDKRLHNDFRDFWKRLKRKLPVTDYINIVEPQGRGAWHCHTLIKTSGPVEMCGNVFNTVRETWGFGRVHVERLGSVDNIGSYFVAYFSNLEIPDDKLKEYEDDITERNGKKYIKGKRLDFYPDYMQIYRYSRGMKKPEAKTVSDNAYIREYPVITYESHKTFENVTIDGAESQIDVIKQQRRKKKKSEKN